MTRDKDEEIFKRLETTPVLVMVELNERMLHDQLVAAIEGGVQYWARVDVGKHQPGWLNYFTAKFQAEGVWHELSVDKLKAGLKVLAQKYPKHFADIIGETGDATTGDVLVQCALLGDIVYG